MAKCTIHCPDSQDELELSDDEELLKLSELEHEDEELNDEDELENDEDEEEKLLLELKLDELELDEKLLELDENEELDDEKLLLELKLDEQLLDENEELEKELLENELLQLEDELELKAESHELEELQLLEDEEHSKNSILVRSKPVDPRNSDSHAISWFKGSTHCERSIS